MQSFYLDTANRKTKDSGPEGSRHTLISRQLPRSLNNTGWWSLGACRLGVEISNCHRLFKVTVSWVMTSSTSIDQHLLFEWSSCFLLQGYDSVVPWRWGRIFIRNITFYQTALRPVTVRDSCLVSFRFRPELVTSLKTFSGFSRFPTFCLFLDHSAFGRLGGCDEFRISYEPVFISAVLVCIWPLITEK
jgi:hypothetical protein